jgi:hypothetical protein
MGKRREKKEPAQPSLPAQPDPVSFSLFSAGSLSAWPISLPRVPLFPPHSRVGRASPAHAPPRPSARTLPCSACARSAPSSLTNRARLSSPSFRPPPATAARSPAEISGSSPPHPHPRPPALPSYLLRHPLDPLVPSAPPLNPNHGRRLASAWTRAVAAGESKLPAPVPPRAVLTPLSPPQDPRVLIRGSESAGSRPPRRAPHRRRAPAGRLRSNWCLGKHPPDLLMLLGKTR